MVDELTSALPTLRVIDGFVSAATGSDHVLDAFVSALVARANAIGLTRPVPVALKRKAAKEGWIAVPLNGSLQMLARG